MERFSDFSRNRIGLLFRLGGFLRKGFFKISPVHRIQHSFGLNVLRKIFLDFLRNSIRLAGKALKVL